MLWINGLSDKACFICGSTKKTLDVNFRDKTFKGVLCLEHVHEKVKQKEGADAAGESSRGAA